MKLLSSLLFSAFIIGSYGTKASACMAPSASDDAYYATTSRRTMMPYTSRRTLLQQVRETWKR